MNIIDEVRDLSKEEKDSLFSLYRKHQGNCSAVEKDPDCKFHRKYIYIYRDKYDFEDKRLKIVKKEADEFKEKWNKELKDGKMKAIEKAIHLLETREETRLTKNGELITLTIEPKSMDIKIAYEMLKIELGEPTNISRNTNIDDSPDVRETINGIKELINKGQKNESSNSGEIIQGGGQEVNNPASV